MMMIFFCEIKISPPGESQGRLFKIPRFQGLRALPFFRHQSPTETRRRCAEAFEGVVGYHSEDCFDLHRPKMVDSDIVP